MNREEIKRKLYDIFSSYDIDVSRITPQAKIGSKNLRLDSVKFLQVCVDIENTFGIELGYQEAMSGELRSVESIIRYIEKKGAKK